MTSTTAVNPALSVEAEAAPPSLRRRVSWGAIIAGAIVAVVVSITLNTLGVAVGASAVNLAQGSTPSAASFGVGTGVWLVLSNLIALAIGAYVAAHLSGVAERSDAALHGLSVWALATLIAAVLLGSVAGGVVSTIGSGAASIVGGTVSGMGSLLGGAGGIVARTTSPSTLQSTAQQLIDRAKSALTSPRGDPAQMTSDQRKAEIARLIGQGISNGTLSPPDSDRLAALVAAETGTTPDQAKARIDQMQQQAKEEMQQAEAKARQAADTAAHAASVAAFSIFGSLLLGAIVAVLAASAGARVPHVYRSSS